MENAGQFIEDEALREQIKGAGIGTSATRDGIITKLEKNKYISLNKNTDSDPDIPWGDNIHVVYYSITVSESGPDGELGRGLRVSLKVRYPSRNTRIDDYNCHQIHNPCEEDTEPEWNNRGIRQNEGVLRQGRRCPKKETKSHSQNRRKGGEECGYTVIAHTDSKVYKHSMYQLYDRKGDYYYGRYTVSCNNKGALQPRSDHGKASS